MEKPPRKLQWGLIGGGEGSQIGPVHRIAAGMDGLFHLAAGALDHDPAKGRAFAMQLGLTESRAYGDWKEMLVGEANRAGDDRLDLVTIATPNATHFEIASAFLRAGFHVLCEKPLTTTLAAADALVALAQSLNKICAVNYGYTGYALVREMRAMVAAGELGAIRLVKAEFAHGQHAEDDPDNPRIRWRYDPRQMGDSAQFADVGIHALHLASFVIGQNAVRLAADPVSCIKSRELEDDAQVNLRFDGGAVGRLWVSAVAIGHQHGLTIEVFGEKGSLRWEQERPDTIMHTPLNGRSTIITRGEAGLSADALKASRLTIGHAEGMHEAFANIYCDLAEAIHAGGDSAALYPRAKDGRDSVAAIAAVIKSGKAGGKWVDIEKA